jgi:hypothetical protein
MKELGPLVLERLCLPADTLAPFGGDVEAWLGLSAVTNRG